MAVLRGVELGYHAANAYQVAAYPAGAQPGDLAVVLIGDRYLPSLPAGWTSVRNVSGTNQSGRIAWHVLDGADVGAGTFTYILAGAGTGSYAVLLYEVGTFRTSDPIASWVDSIATDINQAMPYLVINAGQTVVHYVNGRTAAPGTVVGSKGALLVRRTADPDSQSALYAEEADSDTTVNTVWTATAATTGAYAASVVVQDPPGTTTFPALTGTANLLVAVFDVSPVSPTPTEILYDTGPTLVVYASGTPSPFQVQFQTSATTSFGTVLWSQTLTGQVAGLVSTPVGTALVPNVVSYWRARAGDGTSWGPWTSAQALRPLLRLTEAREYLHSNVGAELAVISHAEEYVHENVGAELALSASGVEYIHFNVGFQDVLDRRGGEYLHEYAFVGVPVPHLWFAWLEYGFPNDHVFLYGQGLGTLMEEYHAVVRIVDSNTGVDQAVSVFDWSVNPAGSHAYDSQRKIYKGAGEASPPVVTQEADIVEVLIPTGIATETAIVDFFFVRHDGGTSNQLPWLLYPQIPWAMTSGQFSARTTNVLRMNPYKTPEHPIPGILAAFAPQPYTVSAGMLEAPPEHLVSSRSTFTFVSDAGTADLEDPVGTPVPLAARWRPLEGSITPRPDLGTGVSLWTPVSGSANAWRIENGTDPYIDAFYPVIGRGGTVERPAMVFPGDAWMRSTSAANGGLGHFSVVLVATISANPLSEGSGGVILSGFDPGGQPAGTHPFDVVLFGDTLYLRFGVDTNRNMGVQIPEGYLSRRPVALAVSLTHDTLHGGAPLARMTLLSDAYRTVSGTVQETSADSVLYLGRGVSDGQAARMDVLEVALGEKLGVNAENELLAALDGAYGVSAS